MTTHYWRQGCSTLNFGEAFVNSILGGFGIDEVNSKGSDCVLVIGSELCQKHIRKLRRRHPRIAVWGFGYSHSHPPTTASLDIRAVRGPLTARILRIDVPQGDPGFLLPDHLPLNDVSQHAAVVAAPHWDNRNSNAWPEYEQFDVETTQADFVDRARYLKGCSFVLTSSLHVAVFCLAYRVPFGLVSRGDETINKPAKFQDVFEWVGIPLKWGRSERDARNWYASICGYRLPDLNPLRNSFPHDLVSVS